MDRTEVYPALPTLPWRLPRRGLVLFEGDSDVPRLSHYFLPRLVLGGQEILFLDGAHCADPREMARLARRRGIPFETFRRSVQIARAFTCFQLTELIRRVPEFMDRFPAQVLMVTAFPDLYYDQDIGEGEARGAFEQALLDLHRWSRPGRRALAVAVFTSCARFTRPAARRNFLLRVRAAASELWRFETGPQGRLTLSPRPPLCVPRGQRLQGGKF